jgi:hypothetical protein
MENHRNKSTGNLALLTNILNFAGNVARTFTVMTEAPGDFMLIMSNILPIVINGYLLLQFYMYWNNRIDSTDKITSTKVPSVVKKSSKTKAQ